MDLWRKEIREWQRGLAEKNLDEIEAAHKIIQLTQEKQMKAQDELKIVHKEKRKLKLGEKAIKKLKVKWMYASRYIIFFSYWTTITELTKG